MGWTMRVSATRDVSAGEEVLLSYGERANGELLALHLHACIHPCMHHSLHAPLPLRF